MDEYAGEPADHRAVVRMNYRSRPAAASIRNEGPAVTSLAASRPRWDSDKLSSEAVARTRGSAQVLEVIAMSEPPASPDAVDRAEPLREDESFAMPDITDTEWEA